MEQTERALVVTSSKKTTLGDRVTIRSVIQNGRCLLQDITLEDGREQRSNVVPMWPNKRSMM